MGNTKDNLMTLYVSTKSRLKSMKVKSKERKAQEALCSRIKNTIDKADTLNDNTLVEKEKEYTAEYYK